MQEIKAAADQEVPSSILPFGSEAVPLHTLLSGSLISNEALGPHLGARMEKETSRGEAFFIIRPLQTTAHTRLSLALHPGAGRKDYYPSSAVSRP